VNGEPQKELANGVVILPFGCEYALRLRNKNHRRAVVKIYIDGENVSGGGYVVEANSFVDIKRHNDKDRAFKFVSLDSAEAVDFGKNGPNPDKAKGTVEARFYLEKEWKPIYTTPVIHDHHHHHHHYPAPPNPWPSYPPKPVWGKDDHYTWCNSTTSYKYTTSLGDVAPGANVSNMASLGGTSMSAPRSMESAVPTSMNFNSAPPVQDGCTVEGYSTGQNFYTTHVDYEDTYTSLKIFLQGHQRENAVQTVPEKRPTNRDRHIDDLERENEELRLKLAEIENRRLKEQLRREESND
jgi:hypothetical protein